MNRSEKGREADWLPPEDLIPLQKAAKLCGLSASHLRLLVRQNEIWGRKIGRDWFTTEQAVRKYQARDNKPGPKPSKKKT
jgi:hypothetical protein